MSVRPLAVGMVLCELAIVDEKTRNVTAASCFSRRVVDAPLAYMPPFYAVVTLVDGHGKMPAKLVIERLDNLGITYERAITLNFADSLQDCTFRENLRTRQPGMLGMSAEISTPSAAPEKPCISTNRSIFIAWPTSDSATPRESINLR